MRMQIGGLQSETMEGATCRKAAHAATSVAPLSCSARSLQRMTESTHTFSWDRVFFFFFELIAVSGFRRFVPGGWPSVA